RYRLGHWYKCHSVAPDECLVPPAVLRGVPQADTCWTDQLHGEGVCQAAVAAVFAPDSEDLQAHPLAEPVGVEDLDRVAELQPRVPGDLDSVGRRNGLNCSTQQVLVQRLGRELVLHPIPGQLVVA